MLPKRFSLLFWMIAALLSAANAWASLGACSGTYNLGTGTNGLVSPGTAAAGCEQVNQQFENFGYSGSSAFPGSGVDAVFGGSSETGGVTATYSSSWAITSGSSVQSDISGGDVIDPSQGDYAITSLSVTANGASLGGSGYYLDFLTVTVYFCVGSATFNCNLSSPNYGVIEYSLAGNYYTNQPTVANYVCYNNGDDGYCSSLTSSGTSSTVSINLTNYSGLAHGTEMIGYETIVNMTSSDGSKVSVGSALDDFYETYEAPEPSTFALAGVALIAIALRRRRI